MQRLVETDTEGVIHAAVRGIDRALDSGMHVLWLLSGGSNIPIEAQIYHNLQHATPQNLTIGLIDERFVPVDSPDSNLGQLRASGIDDGRALVLSPVDISLSLHEAAQKYALDLHRAIDAAGLVVGQFGLGIDGHTAGILPHSAGVSEVTALAIGYEAPDFQRITTTPALFQQVDLAMLVAFGAAKKLVIEQLVAGDVDPQEQPAQLLTKAGELIVYTDQPVEGV